MCMEYARKQDVYVPEDEAIRAYKLMVATPNPQRLQCWYREEHEYDIGEVYRAKKCSWAHCRLSRCIEYNLTDDRMVPMYKVFSGFFHAHVDKDTTLRMANILSSDCTTTAICEVKLWGHVWYGRMSRADIESQIAATYQRIVGYETLAALQLREYQDASI